MVVQEKIEVILELVNNVTGKSKAVIQSVRQLESGLKEITTRTYNYTKKSKEIPNTLNRIRNGSLGATEGITRLNKVHGQADMVNKKMIRGMRRFQFEWLSIMFLGMAINRVFGTYVKQTLDMLGVNELFTESLKYMVFTALEPFLDTIYGVLSAFFDLSEPVQKAIGWFIILMAGLSSLLVVFAMLKLGAGGLAMVFGPISEAIAGAGGLFAWFGSIGSSVLAYLGISLGALLAIIGVIILIVIGMVMAWRENFMNMQGVVSRFVDGIKMMFSGVFEVIKGIVKFFVAVFKGDFEGAKNAVVQIFMGLVHILVGLFQALMEFVAMVGIGIIRIFKGVVDTIIGLFQWLYEKVVGVLQSIWSYAKGVWDSIVSMFSSPITQVINVVTKAFSKRQFGGPVTGGRPYLVGEAGPEMFVPNTSGRIVPNANGGGGIIFAPVYNINIADKREMETLIKANNVRMVDDLRRLIET